MKYFNALINNEFILFFVSIKFIYIKVIFLDKVMFPYAAECIDKVAINTEPPNEHKEQYIYPQIWKSFYKHDNGLWVYY